MAKGAIDIFLVYQFLRRLVTPFDKWDAFKTGVIDKDGKVITKKNDRSDEQENSWGYYDKLTANLKKLLAKVPGGKSRLASFAAALLLLREENLDPDDLDVLSEKLDSYMHEASMLVEEMPTNSVGAGEIAGLGVGAQGEPGISKKKQNKHKKNIAKMIRRKNQSSV